jgi:methyl-accepting chemotaxis protein
VYAVTGDPAAEAAYNNVLAVRNGEVARDASEQVAPGQKRVLLDLLKEYGITDEEFALVKEANTLSDNLVPLEVEAMNAVKGTFKDADGNYTIHREPDRAYATQLVFSDDYITFTKRIMAPMAEFERRVAERTDAALQQSLIEEQRAIMIVIASIGLVLILAGLNMFYAHTVIAVPLFKTSETLKSVFSGGKINLNKNADIHRDNEIGALAAHFNQMMDSVRSLILTIQSEASNLSGIGINLSTHMNETSAAIHEISATISSIKGRSANQSAGVTETAAAITDVTGNIEKLNNTVVKHNEYVNRSSAAIEEMISSIRSVTTTLEKNVVSVNELAGASEAGRSGLSDVSNDIQEIAKESEGLLEINAVMENIAAQTNLLSMNAAIEAAHAGEAGKGFAVVADEIRKLAENSSAQSKTISTVLKRIKGNIDKMFVSTSNVLKKFEAIAENVQTVSAQTANIKAAMEEQNSGGRQILESISALLEMTGQVKDGSQEMLEGSQKIVLQTNSMETATREITNGMNEMSAGAGQIMVSVTHVNTLAVQNSESITRLLNEMSKFEMSA